jgi:hypothetical protein
MLCETNGGHLVIIVLFIRFALKYASEACIAGCCVYLHACLLLRDAGVLSAGNLFAIDYATRATGLLRGVRTIQHFIADLLWLAMTSHKIQLLRILAPQLYFCVLTLNRA